MGQAARVDPQLVARLRAIAESVPSPEDALEPMVQAVIAATNACAGAVCLYDVRQQLLRLAAESGLSDEGCRRLRIARKGQADAWEMPLHGLLNGRAYLIENASSNRFVPALIEDAAEMTSVACLPLYSDDKPLASIILIARHPRSFDDAQLHALETPLREMARVIDATRRRAEGHGAPAVVPSPPPPPPATAAPGAETARTDAGSPEERAPVGDLRGEIDRLRTRLGEAESAAARERRAREELESRFAGGASAGREELQRALGAVHEAESARAAAVAEATRLRADLALARMEPAHAAMPAGEPDSRVIELLAEVDHLRASLAEAEAGAAHEQRAREEMESRLSGGATARQDELRNALAAARDAERGRAAALAEVARLRSELELARIEAMPAADGQERDDRIGPLLAEIDRLRARLAAAEAGAAHEHRARDELETRLTQGVASNQQELRRALEALRHAEEARATTVVEMGRLRAEMDRVRLDAAHVSSEEVDTRVVELGAEIDRLRTRVAEAEAGAAHQHRAREEVEARLTGGVHSGQEELRRALAAARDAEQGRAAAIAEAARLEAELERARLTAAPTPEHADQVAARSAELTAEIDRLHTRLAEAEAGAAHEHRAREELEARLAQAGSEAQQALQEARATARAAEEARGAALADVARLGAELREARGEAARVPELRSEAEARASELAAEIDRLASRLTEAEAEVAQERRARAELETRLVAGAASEEQARGEALAQARASATAAARAEVAQMAAELAAVRAAAARTESLAAELEAAEHARRALAEGLDAAVAERTALVRAAADADAARAAEHAAELEHLRARLADAEGAAAREQRAREAFEAAVSHDLGKRGEDLRCALEAARTADEGRDRAAAELARVRGELVAARANLDTLEREVALGRAETDRLTVEARDAREARDEGARSAAAAHHRQEATAARLAEVEDVLARIERERAAEREAAAADLARVEHELERLRQAHGAAGAERDRLAAELEGTTAAKERFEQALEDALAQGAAQKQGLAHALERAEDAALRLAERERELETMREAHAAEAASLGARLDALGAETDRVRATHASVAADRDRLAADLEGATAAKTQLERSFQEALEASRGREQAAAAEAEVLGVALGERDAQLRALGERLTAETAARDARLGALAADVDALREAGAAVAAERDRLAAELEGAAAGKAHLERTLEQELEDGRRRAYELRDTRGQVWEIALRLDDSTRALAEHSVASAHEIATLTARVETLTTAAHDLREAHAALGAECDRLAADLEGATAAKAHLDDALQAALEDGRIRDQESLGHLSAARAQVWTTAARLADAEQRLVVLDEERATEHAALAARIETLEVEADRSREREGALGAERDRLAADLEGAAAAKAHLEESLKSALDTARSREHEATGLLQEARGHAWAAAVRLAETEVVLRALEEERAAEVGALTTSVRALAAEAERLRGSEAAAASERDHLAAELAGARAANERFEETLAQTLAESRAREDEATARLAEREREIEALQAHAAAPPVVDPTGDAIAAPVAAPPRAATAEPRAAEPATPEHTAAAPPTPDHAARPAVTPRAELTPGLVAVLDDEGLWSGITLESGDLMILAPSDDAVRRLVSAQPGCVAVNLAAAGAMKAVVALRARGVSSRMCGFIANGTSDRALPLGVIEPAGRPLAPDAIVTALAAHAPPKARVVTVGADVDALLSLRQALSRQGVSVSLAWDAKQAIDLFDMVHPHAVVADLGSPNDACAVLARLAVSTPVPAAVLIEGPGDSAAALAMALGSPDVSSQIVSRKTLLASIVRSTGRTAAKAAGPAATPRPMVARR